ncbi:MAG: DUF3078 domain-containing protein [Chitinispirillaceae bacterium]
MSAAFFFFILIISFSASAGVSPWRLSSKTELTFSLNSYSESWKGKESGSLLWVAQFKGLASKQLSERLHNENTLKLAFGQTRIQDEETKKWSAPRKSKDHIDFQSVLHLKLSDLGDPFLSLKVVSQFYDTRNKDNIRFANPVTATKSFGLAKELIKNSDMKWNVRLGGAMRSTIDRNTLLYEQIQGEESTTGQRKTELNTDAGTELVSKFKTKRDDWLNLSAKLTIYEALILPEKSENNFWRYPDISYEQTLCVNITEYIILKHDLKVLYDREIDADPHIRNTLSAGLTVPLSNKP